MILKIKYTERHSSIHVYIYASKIVLIPYQKSVTCVQVDKKKFSWPPIETS